MTETSSPEEASGFRSGQAPHGLPGEENPMGVPWSSLCHMSRYLVIGVDSGLSSTSPSCPRFFFFD